MLETLDRRRNVGVTGAVGRLARQWGAGPVRRWERQGSGLLVSSLYWIHQ